MSTFAVDENNKLIDSLGYSTTGMKLANVSVKSPDTSYSPSCDFGSILFLVNTPEKRMMYSTLLAAQSGSRAVSLKYSNSAGVCILEQVTVHGN